MCDGYQLSQLDIVLGLAVVPDLDGLIERLITLRVEFNRPPEKANG